MKKQVFVVVVGYIHGEVYNQVAGALLPYQPSQRPAVETGIHIYQYNEEGIISHLCTNYPLPEGSDVGYLLTEAAEHDNERYEQGYEEAGLILYPDPAQLEGYGETPDLRYLGAIHGYNEDGSGYWEE